MGAIMYKTRMYKTRNHKSSVQNTIKNFLTAVSMLTIAGFLQAGDAKTFQIEKQPLDEALKTFAVQADLEVFARADLVGDRVTGGVIGMFEPMVALNQLLGNTGLTFSVNEHNTVLIESAPEGNPKKQVDTKDLNTVIEELIVTAQRREQSLIEVPMSISTLSGEELQEKNINNIKELSLAVPELTVFESGPGTGSLFMRGVGNTRGTSAIVGVYIDEAAVTGSPLSQMDLRTPDIERVEVLHGPQGTLYGQGSTAGTIRFITRQPDFGGVDGNVDMKASFTEHGSPNKILTGIANLPIIEDELSVRLVGKHERIGGWIDTPASGKKDVNNQNLYYTKAKALWIPTDNMEVTGTLILQRNSGDILDGGETENHTIMLPEYNPNIELPFEDDYNLYNITAKYNTKDIEILSTTTKIIARHNDGITNFFGVTQRNIFSNNHADTFVQELRVTSAGDERYNWTVGSIYREVESKGISLLTVGIGSDIIIPQLVFEGGSKSKSWAVFSDVGYHFTDKLEIGAGIRFFNDKIRLLNIDPRREKSFDSIDPRVYFSYSITDKIRTYGSIATGFRSGGFNAIGAEFPDAYQTESLVNYELGTKMFLLDNKMNLEFAFYYSDYDDMQAYVISPGIGLGYTSNLGKAEIKGVDWAVRMAFTEQLKVGFNGNIVNAEVAEIPLIASHQPGDQLDYIPDYSYTLFAKYDLEWRKDLPGFWRIDYSEQGKATFTLRTAGMIDESEKINLLNARVGANWKALSFELFANNLLNDNDRISPNILRFSTRLRPRTFGIEAKFDF